VAGGINFIKTIKEGLAGNQISKILGIMNGTCNYILTSMQETGRSFDEVLKEAQELGYAEADPSFDVDGIDTAHKLSILTSLAFEVPVHFDSVHIEGIRGRVSLTDIRYAQELGYKIKLLGVCSMGKKGIQQYVYPAMLPLEHPLANVDGVNNAIFIDGSSVGKLTMQGPGAGRGATASAVVADIIDIAAGRHTYAFGVPVAMQENKHYCGIEHYEGPYYIRLEVKDKPGVLADISDILRDEGVSMDSILQKAARGAQYVHIVGITHDTTERKMRKTVEKIQKVATVLNPPNVLRIEA
jgi:homoserine dehydrogenase